MPLTDVLSEGKDPSLGQTAPVDDGLVEPSRKRGGMLGVLTDDKPESRGMLSVLQGDENRPMGMLSVLRDEPLQAPEEAGITSTPSGQLAVPLAAPAPPVPTPEQVRSQMAMQPPEQKVDDKPLKDIAKKTWATAAQEAYDDNVLRLLPVVGTAMGLYDSYKLFKASNALKNNTATPEQKKFLDDFVAKEAERQGGDKTLGYKATEILLRLPGFALEFAGTGGIAKGVAAGTRKVLGESAKFTARKTAIEAARSQIAKGATKEVTEGLVGQLGREVLKKPGEFIPTKVTEGVGRYTAERLAPSLALAANPLTPQGWRTISGTMDRMAPELGITQDQMGRAKAVIVGDGDDFWEAMAKAYGSEVVSDFTERLGDLADPLVAVFGKNIGAPLRAAFAKRWIGGVQGRTWQAFQNALDKYGWNGVLGEMAEERYADILQPAVESIGDETYAENFKMPTLEDLAAEAVALSVIPTIGLINSARKDRQIQMANAAEVNELTSVDSQQLVGQFSTPEYKQSIQDRFNAEKNTEIGLVGGKKEKLFEGAEVMDVDAELSGFDKAMAQFVRLYAKQVMGQDVIFLKNWREDYNGYRMRDSGNIYLAADRPGAWMVSTLGHEWKHQMDKNEEFAKANAEVRSLAESDAETSKRVNEILQSISKTYLNNADINDQAVRDQAWNEFTPLILETLMSEQNFQEKILTANPTAFQTIVKVVKEIFEKFGEIIDRMSPGTFTRAQWENTFKNSAGGFAKVEDIYTNAVKSYIQRTMSTGAPMSPEMKAAATEVMDSEAAPAEKGEAAKRPREILQEASVLARKEISDLIKSGKTPTNEEQSKILDKYISQVKEEDKKSVVTATEEALPKAMEEISRIEAGGKQLSEQEEQAIIDRYVKEARGEAPAAEPTGPVVATTTTPTAMPMPTQRAPIKAVAPAEREEPQRAPPPGSPLEAYYPLVMDRAMTEINSRANENLADNQKAMILDRYAREAQIASENPASGIVSSFDPANKTAFETEVTKLEGIVAASGVRGLEPYIRSIRNSDTIEEVREAVKDFGERYRVVSGLPAQAGEASRKISGLAGDVMSRLSRGIQSDSGIKALRSGPESAALFSDLQQLGSRITSIQGRPFDQSKIAALLRNVRTGGKTPGEPSDLASAVVAAQQELEGIRDGSIRYEEQAPGEASQVMPISDVARAEFKKSYSSLISQKGFAPRDKNKFIADPEVAAQMIADFAEGQEAPDQNEATTFGDVLELADRAPWDKLPVEIRAAATSPVLSQQTARSLAGEASDKYASPLLSAMFGSNEGDRALGLDMMLYASSLLNRAYLLNHKNTLDSVFYYESDTGGSYVTMDLDQVALARYKSPTNSSFSRLHEATHIIHGRKYLSDAAYRKEADDIFDASYNALDPELKNAIPLMEYLYANRDNLDVAAKSSGISGLGWAYERIFDYLEATGYKGGSFDRREVKDLLYAHAFGRHPGAEIFAMATSSMHVKRHLASIPYKGPGAKPTESLLDRLLSLIKRALKISEKDTLLDAAYNLVMRSPVPGKIDYMISVSEHMARVSAYARFKSYSYDKSKYSKEYNDLIEALNKKIVSGESMKAQKVPSPETYSGEASKKIDETANIISGASYIAALRARLKAKMESVEPLVKKAAKVPEPKVKEPLPEEPKSLYLKADKSGVQMLTQRQAEERQADEADIQETTITRVVFDTKSKRWIPQETIKGRFVTNMAEKDWVMYEDAEGKPTTKKYPKSIWVTPDMLPQSVPARDYGSYATLVSKDGTRRVNVKIASMTDKYWVVINGIEGSGVRKDKSGKDVAIPWTQLARYSKAEYPTVEDQKPITFVEKEIDAKSGVRNRVTLKNSVYWSHRGRSGWAGFREDGKRMNVDSERFDISDAPQKPSYVLTEQDGEYASIVFTRSLARALSIARKEFNWKDSLLEAGIAEATKRFKDLLYRAQVTEAYGNSTFEREIRDFAKKTSTPERITTRFSWDKQLSALLSALSLSESRGDFAAAKLIGADIDNIKKEMPRKWDEVDPIDAEDISAASALARLYIASRAPKVVIGGVIDGGKRAGDILSTDAPSGISEERTRGDEISSEGPKLSDQYIMKGKPKSDYDRDPFIESVIDKVLGAKLEGKKEPTKEQVANETGVPPAQVAEIKKSVDTTGFKPLQIKLIEVLGLRKGRDVFEDGEATVLNELEKSEPGLIDRIGEETILKEITLTQMLLDTKPGEASRSLFGEASRVGQLREKFPDQAKELDELISDKYTDKLLFGQAMEFLGDIGPAGLDAAYSKYMRNIARKVNARGVSTMDAVDKISGRILIEALFSRGQENDVKRGSNIVLKLMRSASASSAALRKSGLDWNEYESGMVYVLMSEYLGEAATKAGVVKKWSAGFGKTKAEMMAMSYAINYVRRRMNKSLSEMTAAEEGDLTNAANAIVTSISSYLPTAPETITLLSGEVVDNPEYRIQLGTYLGALSSSTASLGDKALEIWKAGLLSGIGTMFVQNPLSNFANGFYEFGIKRPLEILLSNLPEGFLGTPSRGEGDSDARSGELLRSWKAMWKAQSSAAKIAWISFRSEIPYYGVQQGGGPGVIGASGVEISDRYYSVGGLKGRFIRLPFRFLTMADDFFKHLFVVGHATAYSYREALDLGKTGADIDAHIEAQLKNPKSDSMKKGLNLAFDLVFQKRLGKVGQAVTGVRQAAPIGLGFILPFVTTPVNILKQGLRRTPLGTPLLLYRTAKAYYMRKRTPPGKPDYTREDFISHLSEQALAWATTGLIASMIGGDGDDDEPRVQITGGRPLYGKDAGKQQAFERDQGPPSMSIKFGDGPWISYSKIEPLSTFLAPIVNAIEAMNKAKNGDEWEAAASEAYSKTVDALMDKTFMGAMSDIVRAGENPKDITRWAGSFASSWVPSIIRQGLKASTPSESDLSIKGKPLSPEWFDSFGEMVKEQAAPGTTGQVRIDWLGREVRKSGPIVGPNTDVLYRLFTFAGIQLKGAEQDKLSRMITVWNQTSRFNAKENFEYYPSKPSKWITRKGERKFLTAEQYMEYQKLIGKMTQQFARSRRFNYDNPTLRDIEALEKIRANAVERAGNMIARKYRL